VDKIAPGIRRLAAKALELPTVLAVASRRPPPFIPRLLPPLTVIKDEKARLP
jgi:hypothetical protein